MKSGSAHWDLGCEEEEVGGGDGGEGGGRKRPTGSCDKI